MSSFGSVSEWLKVSQEAVHLADQTDDAGLRAALRVRLVYATYAGADAFREALRWIEEGIALCEEDVQMGTEVMGFSPYLAFRANRGFVLTELGRLREGREESERAVRLAEDLGEPVDLCFCLNLASAGNITGGEMENALFQARQSSEIAEARQMPFALAWTYSVLGNVQAAFGEWSAAVPAFERVLSIIRSHNTTRELEGRALAGCAEAVLECGEPDRARRMAEEAVAIAHQRGYPGAERVAQLTLARVLIRTAGRNARQSIEAALERTSALIDQSGCEAQRPFVHLEQAHLARLIDDEATYKREFHEAHRLFTEMGATGHAARVAKELS